MAKLTLCRSMYAFRYIFIAVTCWATVAARAAVYVNDRTNHEIISYNSSGNPTIFADFGSSYPIILDQPTALAFDMAGNLYVAAQGNSIILKYDSAGTATVFADSTDGVANPSGLAL